MDSLVNNFVPMGVTRDLIKAGDGVTHPQPGDECTMHYTGTLAANGNKFDSSVDKLSLIHI